MYKVIVHERQPILLLHREREFLEGFEQNIRFESHFGRLTLFATLRRGNTGVGGGEKLCQVLSPFISFLSQGIEGTSAVLSALVFALLCPLVASHPLLS